MLLMSILCHGVSAIVGLSCCWSIMLSVLLLVGCIINVVAILLC
jgi:hypothetical protein